VLNCYDQWVTLRSRIYLLIALAVAPAFALLAYNHAQSLRREAATAEQQALQSTLLVSAELDQILKGFVTLLLAAAETPMVRNLDGSGCGEYLQRLESINSSAGWIVAADGQGTIRCGRHGVTGSIADRDYFSGALNTNGPTIGSYSIGKLSGVAILPLAHRFETSEGPGVLVVGVRLDWMRQLFVDRFSRLPPNSSLTIVDRNGIILVRLPNSDREGQPLSNYQYVVDAPAPGVFRSAAEKNADGIARFLGFAPLDSPPRGVAIAVGFPQDAVLASVRRAAMLNYLLLSLVTILAVAAAVLVGRAFIRRPMKQLLDTVENWGKQDLSARVKTGRGRSEFDQLGRTFNSMADELEAALKHKDILLRELSHRVMNSLQTVSALFRLEAKSVEDPAARARFDQAVRRLDAIALVYRRMQTTDGVAAIEFSGFLTEICRALTVSTDTPCAVEADQQLLPPNQAVSLALIVNELVTNAIKHGKGRSEPVVVAFKEKSGRWRLSVRNSGDLAPNVEPKTTGFGRKMIASLVSQLNGELAVKSGDGTTEIAVTFPLTASPSAITDAADRTTSAGTTAHLTDA
jgi:two-component sensor histidine kinase